MKKIEVTLTGVYKKKVEVRAETLEELDEKIAGIVDCFDEIGFTMEDYTGCDASFSIDMSKFCEDYDNDGSDYAGCETCTHYCHFCGECIIDEEEHDEFDDENMEEESE